MSGRAIGACIVVASALAGTAHAQPAGAQAETLFDKGKALMAKSQFAEACTAFEASQRLDPATTTLMNLANCREKNQQLATAWGLFLQVERELRAKSDDTSTKLQEVAHARAAKLAPLVSKLTIHVATPAVGEEITRGTEHVASELWNQALPVDGGSYAIVARAPGKKPFSTSIAVEPSGDGKTIEIPSLEDGEALPVARPTPVASTVTHPAGSLALPVTFGIIAVALGGGALGSELWGRSIYDDAKAANGDRTAQVRLWDKANARHYAAQAMGIGAIGCAGAALYLFVTRKPAETVPAIVPVATGTTVGVQLSF